MAPIRDRASRAVLGRLSRNLVPSTGLALERIGSDYGGWVVPTALIEPDWVCYCGGVGEDISFDLVLIERFGCRVVAFDPTPRAIAHVERLAPDPRSFRLVPVGLWSEDATLRFYAPRDPAHVSHSALNLQGTSTYFEAPCRSLGSLMAELGHPRVDLLKLDIEGAEHAVLGSMLAAGIRPRVVCAEMDRPMSPLRLWRTAASMRRGGYALVAVDGWNLTWVRDDALAHATRAGTGGLSVVDPSAAGASDAAAGPSRPRVSFILIVLDGEPFTRYALRAIYPFAHQVVVAEGAAPGAAGIAGPDGHSRDGTLEVLRAFVRDEDPDGKVTLVTAEDEGHPDGFWPGEKDEQSRACARRATGDWLWQVDIDEAYRAADMGTVLGMLSADPSIDAVSFEQRTFWGGLDYVVDGWYLRRGASTYHRLFAWRPGHEYATHRPPTVVDAQGRDLRAGHWVDGRAMARRGVRLFHYSLLLRKQVLEKCEYYANAPWARRDGALEWANEAWMRLGRPFRVHNVYDHPSWLERYRGAHPASIVAMVEDLRAAGSPELRRTDDIERLLASPSYRLGRLALQAADPVDRALRLGVRAARKGGRVAGAAASAALDLVPGSRRGQDRGD